MMLMLVVVVLPGHAWPGCLTLKAEMLTRRVVPGLQRPPPPPLPPIQLSHQSIPGQVDWRPRERPDCVRLIQSTAHHSLLAQPSLQHKHPHTPLQTVIQPPPQGRVLFRGQTCETKLYTSDCGEDEGNRSRDRTARFYVKK